MKDRIKKAKKGKRVVCSFSYKDYESNELIVHYINQDLLETSVSKNHAKMLIQKYNGKLE
jgi:hypothetical protein